MLISTDRALCRHSGQGQRPTAYPDQAWFRVERKWVPMAAEDSPSSPDAKMLAHDAADRLALTLEEVGFDVGVAFPGLHGASDKSGTPTVHLGNVTSTVALDLSAVLANAVGLGATLPPR